jgi:hypothetical protein
VKPIASLLKAFAGCDHGTADCSHVWRIGGTLNWPNGRKVAAGRPRELQLVRVAKQWDGTAIPLAALVAVLSTPTLEGVASNGHASGTTLDDDCTARDALADQDPVEGDGNTTARGDAQILVETIVNVLPQKLRERITDPATGDRSRDLFYVIRGLIS